jgi:hypothetical protein
MLKPLLVGETNPYSVSPAMALYPLPEWSAGGRLALILGLTRGEYLDRFDRANLCCGKWSLPIARLVAKSLLVAQDRSSLVLLGSRVAAAFRVPFDPYCVGTNGTGRFVVLPHPSGRCRLWNNPGAVEKARAALRLAGALPW